MGNGHACYCSGDLVVDLKPLPFGSIETEHGLLTCQALVEQPSAPGSPVFALTLSMGLPGDGREQAMAKFRGLRSELRGDFLLRALEDDDDLPGDDPDSGGCDAEWEILLEPEFVSTTLDGEYRAVMVLQAPLPGLPELPEPAVAGPMLAAPVGGPHNINAGMAHIYRSKNGGRIYTEVTSSVGEEHLHPPRAGVLVTTTAPQSATAKKVRIENLGSDTANYTMSGSWRGPKRRPI